MDKPQVEQSIQMAPLQVTLIKQDVEVPESLHSDEGTHVRIVGCDGKRQAVVEHYHGSLVIKERGKPDGHVLFLNLDQIFRKCFVAIIKANDGMVVQEALQNGLDRIETYEQVVDRVN